MRITNIADLALPVKMPYINLLDCLLIGALLFQKGAIVMSVPYRLER